MYKVYFRGTQETRSAARSRTQRSPSPVALLQFLFPKDILFIVQFSLKFIDFNK